jgi:hypothetical protein
VVAISKVKAETRATMTRVWLIARLGRPAWDWPPRDGEPVRSMHEVLEG